jgi:Protein of unknown function (DUF3097)
VEGRYAKDVLAESPARSRQVPTASGVIGLVVEDAASGWCGAVVGWQRGADGWAVLLEDRHGRSRPFAAGPRFLVDGQLVDLVRPSGPAKPTRATTASGSVRVHGERARVARASRIWVEGRHDAELVERVWGADLRLEGVVVEELSGVDHLIERLGQFDPEPARRVGVLVDHLLPGTKEHSIAADAMSRWPADVLVVGHPFIDIWQAIKPTTAGITAWPDVPRGTEWKAGVCAQLGWEGDSGRVWSRLLATVSDYTDLEPELLGRVEELIDFVTVE